MNHKYLQKICILRSIYLLWQFDAVDMAKLCNRTTSVFQIQVKNRWLYSGPTPYKSLKGWKTVGYESGMLSRRAKEWKEHSGIGELFLED